MTAQTTSEAKKILDALSPQRMQSAIDFINYLYEREIREAEEELETIPGLKKNLEQSLERVKSGDYTPYEDIRKGV